jgi:hypothetical protein
MLSFCYGVSSIPRKKKIRQTEPKNGVCNFRHADARHPNNLPAGVAPTYEVRERQTTRYSYAPPGSAARLGRQGRANLVRGGRGAIRMVEG